MPPTPHQIAKAIAELKQQATAAKLLAEPWGYFFDKLAENPTFTKLGKPAKNAQLTEVLRLTYSNLNRGEVAVSVRLLHIKEQGMWHGSGTVGGKLFAVYFFDDIQQGIASRVDDFATGRMTYTRISTTPVSRDDAFLQSAPKGEQ